MTTKTLTKQELTALRKALKSATIAAPEGSVVGQVWDALPTLLDMAGRCAELEERLSEVTKAIEK